MKGDGSEVYPGNQRNIQDRGTMSHSFGVDSGFIRYSVLFVVQTSQFERMKRFQHHTEQQMQRMSQEPKQVRCLIHSSTSVD